MKIFFALMIMLLSMDVFAYSYDCTIGDGVHPNGELKGAMAVNSKVFVATVNGNGVYLSNQDGRFLLGLVTTGLRDLSATVSTNIAVPLSLVYVHDNAQLMVTCAISPDVINGGN